MPNNGTHSIANNGDAKTGPATSSTRSGSNSTRVKGEVGPTASTGGTVGADNKGQPNK